MYVMADVRPNIALRLSFRVCDVLVHILDLKRLSARLIATKRGSHDVGQSVGLFQVVD